MREYRKKRSFGWRVLLCAICLIFALTGISAEAHAAETARISGNGDNAERGEDVTVSFYLSKNPGVWGVKGELVFDTSVLTLKSIKAVSVFSSGEMIMGEDMSKSPFPFMATGNTIENKLFDGTLIKATFNVNSKAELGEYVVGIRIKQLINTDGDDVPVSTSGAKITVVKCLHRKTVLKNVVEATEEAEGYSGDAYCSKCDVLVKRGTKTPKYVNPCKHPNPTRTTVTAATCEAAGLVQVVCPDCSKSLPDETIPATGHKESGLTDWKAATTTEEGYTGDILCQNCNMVMQKGTVIPKIEIVVFNMTSPAEDTYFRGAQAGLAFVSDAAFETFVRVEVDGSILDAKNYTAASGSTQVTLKPEYLETLADGKHTVTIVSDAGTASAQFHVAQPPVEEPAEPAPPVSYRTLLIITAVTALVALVCLVVTIILVVSNKKNKQSGRFVKDEEA